MGKLVVFEGLDCSFKETNSKAYLEYLLAKGEKAELYAFPRYEREESIFVRNYLAGKYGKSKDINPGTISMLYMMDMFDCIARNDIIWKLDQGYTIIFDRYWYSNLYFQIGIKQMKYKDSTILTKEFSSMIVENSVNGIAEVLELPMADVVIKLQSDPNIMLDFVHKKHSATDQHESNDELLLSVADVFNNYIPLGNYCKSCKTVYTTQDGEIRSREDIFEDILKVLDEGEDNNGSIQ